MVVSVKVGSRGPLKRLRVEGEEVEDGGGVRTKVSVLIFSKLSDS